MIYTTEYLESSLNKLISAMQNKSFSNLAIELDSYEILALASQLISKEIELNKSEGNNG